MSGRTFVVERINWAPKGDRRKSFLLLPGATRVACFDDADAAEADCRRREAEARAAANPFAYGGPALHYQTSFDEGRLRDWLLDAGLEPPGKGGAAWRAWWDRHSPSMTELQRARVWQALDKIRFFRVVEGSARVVFVVVEVHWAYNDQEFYRGADAVAPVQAYTSRDKAEAVCRRREREARLRYNPFEMNSCGRWEAWTSLPREEFRRRVEALGLTPPDEDRFDSDWSDWWHTDMTTAQRQGVWDLIDRAAFFEVAEVELPG
jgi:hypothetical protein